MIVLISCVSLTDRGGGSNIPKILRTSFKYGPLDGQTNGRPAEIGVNVLGVNERPDSLSEEENFQSL